MDPKISIITPSFNSEKYIAEAIRSVLQQTYSNWEMIVVDDCSSDSSVKIVEEFANQDRRIVLLQNKENLGAGPTRNKAIEFSTGQIIAFLDSDDIWLRDKLEKHVNFMLREDAAFSHTSYGFINETGKVINKTFHVSDFPIEYKDLLKRTEISCLTAMYDVNKVGKMYMPDLRVKQDYALWLSILKKGFVSMPLDEELAFYRQRKNSNTNKKYKLVWKHIKFLYQTQNLGFFKTIYYTFWWAYNGVFKYYISKITG
ncbi:glycosyltransferase family 2 protein [Flagellimonas halotolerans]|uniref:Glycosyltransferase family 2 protein n=1 Tax=Flagellimonas halotolerans TaxID=3112164 RepID=A0ABU6ILJ6_9FLAO|nr:MULTISPECIES: glycosyltransferase family 2 protein [unclassified Allomuricauda]MEC3963977.1 glycosyltransferase family 2 protein [Muricauda sp. SYSU M86414]MEC4263847.1 glycosyltransferase family 2 protein [Muricauda sp. SYSU M84420]